MTNQAPRTLLVARGGARRVRTKAAMALHVLIIAALAQAQAQGGRVEGATLRFLGNQALPPMVYLEKGKAKGIVVDLVQKLGEEMGTTIAIEPMNWARAQEIVAQGGADALIQINRTDSRLLVYDFSEDLLESRFSIFAHRAAIGITWAQDLRGLRVGVEANSFPQRILEADHRMDLVPLPTILEGFRMLEKGQVDVVVADEWVGQYLLAVNGIDDVSILGAPVAVQSSAIAVRKGNHALLAKIDEGLRKMKADGSYAGILGRWRPEEIVYRTREQIQSDAFNKAAYVIVVILVFSILVVFILSRQLAERKRSHIALAESEGKFKDMFYSNNSIMLLVEPKGGRILEANQSALDFYGYSVEEMRGMSIKRLNRLEDEKIAGDSARILEQRQSDYRRSHFLKNGETRLVEIHSSPVKIGDETFIFSIIHDTTERQRAEMRIQSLLDEKVLILREVHHRIKNNMNTMKSLVRLQRQSLTDEGAIEALKDVENRFQSMLVLYDKLYQSSSFTELSAKDYLSSLVREVVANFPMGGSVEVTTDIEDFLLDVKTLQTLGIILNELVTNIMKYALEGIPGARITVAAGRRGKVISLSVHDNGLGMPEDLDFVGSPGFGLMLIGQLARQLEASLRIERGGGTTVILEFRH